MLRQVFVQKFHKVVRQYRPDVFSSLVIAASRPHSPYVQHYQAYDQQNYYQLYLTDKSLQPLLEDLPFVEASPKMIILASEEGNLLIEQRIDETLYDALFNNQQRDSAPYIQEPLARQLLTDIRSDIQCYQKHKMDYNVMHPTNIVRKGAEWELSAAGLVLGGQKDNIGHYKGWVKPEGKQAYSLGSVLFFMLFGFAPLENNLQLKGFEFKDYLKFLDTGNQEIKQSLKIYYFAERLLEVSPLAKKLIEDALTGNMTIQSFYDHEYFKNPIEGKRREHHLAAREIKMLGQFPQSYQSLVMAAIDHRKKNPHEKLLHRLPFALQMTPEQTLNHLKRHPILSHVNFDANFAQNKVLQVLKEDYDQFKGIKLQYFYRDQQFDPETDYPCRQLIKIIELCEQKRAMWDERHIKLYAYPYAIVFQLQKVKKTQPKEIKHQISRTCDDLLQLSQLYRPKKFDPLHDTKLLVHSFEEMKIRFRTGLNDLYRHFLKQAMKRYNIRKDAMGPIERSNQRKIGLEYYRLCLKLMECSLLVRKDGNDLDLSRIETSERKQIQNDLNDLLKRFFPNKIELS